MSQRNNRTVAVSGRSLGPADLARLRATEKRTAGGSIDAVPPSVEAVRAAVDAAICPFCGSGPWKMLPVHTNKIHSVDKWQLRELAGLTTTEPLCSPEVINRLREIGRNDPARIARANAGLAANGRSRQRWTTAGRTRQTETITAWARENPEALRNAQRRAGRSVSTDGRRRQAEAQREWHRNNPKSDDVRRAFVERMRSPEAVAARAAARAGTLQPCGTAASYKRGCRCEQCRAGKRASRAGTGH